jgi:ribosomal protein S21
MVVVKKQRGESEDKLIARFKKKVVDSGILEELRERSRFKPNSERKKEKVKRMQQLISQDRKRNY